MEVFVAFSPVTQITSISESCRNSYCHAAILLCLDGWVIEFMPGKLTNFSLGSKTVTESCRPCCHARCLDLMLLVCSKCHCDRLLMSNPPFHGVLRLVTKPGLRQQAAKKLTSCDNTGPGTYVSILASTQSHTHSSYGRVATGWTSIFEVALGQGWLAVHLFIDAVGSHESLQACMAQLKVP